MNTDLIKFLTTRHSMNDPLEIAFLAFIFLMLLLLSIYPDWVGFKFKNDSLQINVPFQTYAVPWEDLIAVEKHVFPKSLIQFYRHTDGYF